MILTPKYSVLKMRTIHEQLPKGYSQQLTESHSKTTCSLRTRLGEQGTRPTHPERKARREVWTLLCAWSNKICGNHSIEHTNALLIQSSKISQPGYTSCICSPCLSTVSCTFDSYGFWPSSDMPRQITQAVMPAEARFMLARRLKEV